MIRDPRIKPAPVAWWIVEAEQLGRTAMPGRALAYQGAEVIRGLRYRVHAVRPANPRDFGDRIAIQQSQEELRHAAINHHVRAGNLRGASHAPP